MTITELYKYSWFSNLSYVKWVDAEGIAEKPIDTEPEDLILAANAAERNPGVSDGAGDSTVNSLGEKIFYAVEDNGLGWQLPSFHPDDDSGFAASFYVNADTGEKVLGIRGTDPANDPVNDVLVADLLQIGFIGMALSQSVSLFNYVQVLKGELDTAVTTLVLKDSVTDGAAPANAAQIDAGAGVTLWVELETDPSKIGKGLQLLASEDAVTVTGHSLGGHLAAIAVRMFPGLFDQAVTYNAPGFDPATAGTVTAGLLALLAPGPFKLLTALGTGADRQLTDEIFDDLFAPHLDVPPANDFAGLANRITSIVGEDVVPGDDREFVSYSFTGTPASEQQFVATEQNSHLIEPFMDNLAVQALLESMDADIGVAGASALLQATANEAARTEESLLDSLAELFDLEGYTPLGVNDISEGVTGSIFINPGDFAKRTDIHTHIIALEQAITAKPGIALTSLVGTAAAQQATPAALAHRYALVELNPFAVTGSATLYDTHNPNGELTWYDPATGAGTLSTAYLKDRAEMLQELLQDNAADDDYSDAISWSDRYYHDNTSSIAVGATNAGKYIRFADDSGQTLAGSAGFDSMTGSGNDRLYSGAGNDILQGNQGTDYLEGGKGNDKYIYNSGSFTTGDGWNTFLDVGGSGSIEWNSTTLSTVQQKSDDELNLFMTRKDLTTFGERIAT